MPRNAQRNNREPRLLIIVIVVIVAIGIGGAALYILSRDGTPRTAAKRPQSEVTAAPVIQPAFRTESISAPFYYPLDGQLVSGSLSVKRQSSAQMQAKELMIALMQDQIVSAASCLRDLAFRDVYIDERGAAWVDFSSARQSVSGSAWDELLAVYAVVNTITQNIEEIKQVALLLDGKQAETLSGHVDISRPFTKRMDLVQP